MNNITSRINDIYVWKSFLKWTDNKDASAPFVLTWPVIFLCLFWYFLSLLNIPPFHDRYSKSTILYQFVIAGLTTKNKPRRIDTPLKVSVWQTEVSYHLLWWLRLSTNLTHSGPTTLWFSFRTGDDFLWFGLPLCFVFCIKFKATRNISTTGQICTHTTIWNVCVKIDWHCNRYCVKLLTSGESFWLLLSYKTLFLILPINYIS